MAVASPAGPAPTMMDIELDRVGSRRFVRIRPVLRQGHLLLE